jgi:hypothetical protein
MPLDDYIAPGVSGYQPDLNACPSCALFQATGGRCPPARDAYDLEGLRMAVQAEAGVIRTLADLIQLERVPGAKPTLALMPGAPKTIVNESKEKEVEYAPAGSVR